MEEAFQQCLAMATTAVDLAIPDYVGLTAGTNELHLWPDACKYGIGAGIFQAAPAVTEDLDKATPNINDTHYTLLGVTPWCTKLDIEQAFQRRKKVLTKACKYPAGMVPAQEARDLLMDPS